MCSKIIAKVIMYTTLLTRILLCYLSVFEKSQRLEQTHEIEPCEMVMEN